MSFITDVAVSAVAVAATRYFFGSSLTAHLIVGGCAVGTAENKGERVVSHAIGYLTANLATSTLRDLQEAGQAEL